MNKVYYSQIDTRWKNHPYPSQALPNATIGSGGCGAVCGAMIVSMLRQIITPKELGDIFVKDGIRVNGGTSNKAFDSYIADKYQLKVNLKWKIAEAKECLERGGLVVARCLSSKGTLFTTGGHFIVLAGFTNNEFLVYDPYLYTSKFNTNGRNGKARVEGTNVYVTYENMKEYGGYNELWCFEPTNVDTNIDTTIPETKQEEIKTGRVINVNTNSYLNVRNGAGTNCAIVAKKYLNDKVLIYETVNSWHRIGGNEWVSADYIKVEEKTPENTYRVKTVIAKTGLNVRSQPTTNSNRVTGYKYGTKVKVYSIENGWAKGTKGYMCAKYLR